MQKRGNLEFSTVCTQSFLALGDTGSSQGISRLSHETLPVLPTSAQGLSYATDDSIFVSQTAGCSSSVDPRFTYTPRASIILPTASDEI